MHPGLTQWDPVTDWGRQVLPDAGADLDGCGGSGEERGEGPVQTMPCQHV